MLRRLALTAALLMLLPEAAQGQQASVAVYARVVERVETQRLVPVADVASAAQPAAEAAGRMPSSWRWEVRGAAEGDSLWAAPVLAAGQGGAGWEPGVVRQPGVASYVFAPI